MAPTTSKDSKSSERTSPTLKKLISKRNAIFSRIQDIYNHSKSVFDNETSQELFLGGAESLDNLRTEFHQVLDEITDAELEINPDSEPNYKSWNSFEELYCCCRRVASKLNANKTISETKSIVGSSHKSILKLPKLELVSFSGEPTKWPIFYQSFQKSVHEHPDLTDNERLQYLLGKLSGRALSVCTGVAPNAENYNIIWQTLVNKYEDKRSLATSYLDQIIEFKSFNTATSKNLDMFLDKFCSAVACLKALKIDDLSDFMLLYLSLKKIDSETAKSFEMHMRTSSMPSFDDFITYLREQTKILERTAGPSGKRNYNEPQIKLPQKSINAFVTANTHCVCCNQTDHFNLYKCPQFLKMSVIDRFNYLKENKACTNCLSTSHSNSACKSVHSCRHCNNRHHSLICRKQITSQAPALQTARLDGPLQSSARHRDSDTSCLISVDRSNTTCLLGTIQVNVLDANNHVQTVRALVDPGSQSNFITAECCNKLNLRYNKVSRAIVKGIGSSPSPIKGATNLCIFSQIDNNVSLSLDACIIDRITDKLPTVPIDIAALTHLRHVILADRQYNEPGNIDILIGAQLFGNILLSGRITGPPGTPTGFETIFGYMLIGNSPTLSTNNNIAISMCSFVEPEPTIDAILTKFWQLEEVSCEPAYSPADRECEEIFNKNVSRDTTGRYTVALPFARDPSILGDSYQTAKKRFLSFERRFDSCPDFRMEYNEIIREYLLKDYISPLPDDDRSEGYYIPHHAVVRADKATTKVRMVMDASAKTDTNVSLNDTLHSGVNLQNDLFLILLDFRLFEIAFTCDLKQMFLQILVTDEHRKYQKFLYRFDNASPLDTYVFNRVCFGNRSSPYLAMRVVRKLCEDERSSFPRAAYVASHHCYTDDLCYSVPTIEDSHQLKDELMGMFKAGGFELVKWSSNCRELLDSLPESHRYDTHIQFDGSTQALKVLGLQWSPITDEFYFTVTLNERPCTKRNILSVIARQFDILGLIAPVILHAKLILQRLHVLKLDWDDNPPQEIINCWERYIRELPLLRDLRFKRHLGVTPDDEVSIISFSDASEKGYGCAVFVKIESPNRPKPIISLVCAKSKVSPLKTVSVARLEICAALLMSNLVRRVIDTYSLRHPIANVYCFTDSMVTLHWVHSSPHRFKTFIATRITKIISNLPAKCFFHVPGKENPSDCLSRGLTPAQFIAHPVWFSGPNWLQYGIEKWPITSINDISVTDNLPETKVLSLAAATDNDEPHPLLALSLRVSTWRKLLNAIVYVYRFIKKIPRSDYITAEDLNYAEMQLLKAVQSFYFSDEIKKLTANKQCSNAINKLTPFLDGCGLIRVGGRLRHSDLTYEQQHPILLPRKDRVMELLVTHYHRKHCHTGPLALMSILRQRYWIISCRNIVRQITHKCNFCFRAKPKQSFPLMGDLPACRVNDSKAFFHTATDFAGPIAIVPYRKRGVRSIKSYLCIYVCLVTRGVHVEITTDLTTNSFISAFKRFISRRGAIFCMYSDNAGTFQSASKSLSDVQNFVNSDTYKDAFANELTNNRILWKFGPPRSPHFGGHYEIFVKAFKNHLYRVVGSQLLTYEELLTVTTQIECVINSRPLTPLSEDPSELSALTPAHFLMSTPLKHLPQYNETDAKYLLRRYKLLDQMVTSFAKRWKHEYLHQLQSREKWNTNTNPIEIGTVVVILTDNTPPLHWPLGVVVAVYYGEDNICRVALVKTATGVYKRPVVRLCPLPSQ